MDEEANQQPKESTVNIYAARRERKSCERMRTTWEPSTSQKPYPSSVNFFVSARCNMNCRMCFARFPQCGQLSKAGDIGLKVNHVVTRKNLNEDLTELFTAMEPARLKIFRVMPVQGENAEDSRPLLISDHDFHCYVHRMRRTLSEALPDCNIVAENNDEMRGSYAMVSPDGRFFDQVHGFHRFSQPILEVGIDEAWSKVEFSQKIFKKRGGIYKWQRETTKQR
jgi:hypothetical protein